jgi:VIT1/CCC1 family predicted Fe2+/Mn2+ transporter
MNQGLSRKEKRNEEGEKRKARKDIGKGFRDIGTKKVEMNTLSKRPPSFSLFSYLFFPSLFPLLPFLFSTLSFLPYLFSLVRIL